MLQGRPALEDDTGVSDDERARIQGRLKALGTDRSNDSTRQIGPAHTRDTPSYDGSLAAPVATASSEVETRAYLLTADGGVLAELPCSEDAEPVVIGRAKAASIRIDDPFVHRLQAEIRWNALVNAHFITHAGGDNGTYVNRHRVQKPFRLVGGEQLRFGKTRLVYRIRR